MEIAAVGATYFRNTTYYSSRHEGVSQVARAALLAFADVFVGVAKAGFYTLRSVSFWSSRGDSTIAGLHIANAARRARAFAQSAFCLHDPGYLLRASHFNSVSLALTSKLATKIQEEELEIPDATADTQYTPLHPRRGEGAEPFALYTLRTYDPSVGSSSTVPVMLLEHLDRAKTRRDALLAIARIMTHESVVPSFRPASTQSRSGEYCGHHVTIPEVRYRRDQELNDRHPVYLALEKNVPKGEAFDHFVNHFMWDVKESIVDFLKVKVYKDVARAEGVQRIHKIGDRVYSNRAPESVRSQVNSMWHTIYENTKEALRGARDLDIFREAALRFDHMCQTGFAISSVPLHLRVMNVSLLTANAPEFGDIGLQDFLGERNLRTQLVTKRNMQSIHLAEDMSTLTTVAKYDLFLETTDAMFSEHKLTLEGKTVVDLTHRKAHFSWKMTQEA